MSARRAAAAAALVTAAAASPVAASPLLEAVGGFDGGGANARFSSPGVSSTYFNPALITQVDRTLSFGIVVLQDAVSMTLDARNNVDVPESIYDAYNPDLTAFEDPTLPSDWVENGCSTDSCSLDAAPRQGAGSSGVVRPYATVGIAHQLFDDHLVLGMLAIIPVGKFTGGDQFFVDEREQFFSNSLHAELLSDRLSAPSIAVSLASRVYEGLSVGVGAGIRLRTDAYAETFVLNANDQAETLQLSTEIEVSIGVAPYFSLAYELPNDGGLISATVHSPNRFDVGVGLETTLPGGDHQAASRDATLDYIPWQIGLGGEFALPLQRENLRLALTGGAVYRTWSQYVDRQSNRPTGDYAWSNTVSPTVGARVAFDQLEAAVDLSWTPTPVPLQTGRTNYVDNDRVGGDARLDYGFRLGRFDMRAGLGGQVERLVARHQTKIEPDTTPGNEDRSLVLDEFPDDAISTDRQRPVAEAVGLQTNNPGWPGYGSEGWLWSTTLTLEFLYGGGEHAARD
ncbi:MAG: hypothetical protein H6700_06175 [Myxococcales bacterium]|nr:hypothetical protein [Myxococcales bacterium]MCB9531333.1 hypothetical protein [Myxococcales bacterium]